MIEIDTGDTAGRPCILCGESTADNASAAVKRPTTAVSYFFFK